MENECQTLRKMAIKFASGSFVLGTLIFVLNLMIGNAGILLIGLIYVLCAAIANLMLLLVIILSFYYHYGKHNAIYLESMGILLLNIPIVILYFYLTTLTIEL